MPRKIVLLLVDDETEVLRLLTLRLEGNGYQVLTAGDGAQALELAKREKPDLILLDLLMPVMDGFTALSLLKSLPETREIPVIILSAKGQPNDLKRAWELGAKDYILKPFGSADLLEKIAKVFCPPAKS